MKHTKGSKYTGVHKCLKTNCYYFKNTYNKKLYKSILFKKDIDAAKKYDEYILKQNPKTNKINFKISRKRYLKTSVKKTAVKKTSIKKNLSKRPKISEYIKITIFSRQHDKCRLCKKELGIGRIVDHIIPRSLGGIDNINNYQAICGACNKWKSYSFDKYIKNHMKPNKKYSLNTILKLQRKQFYLFNGPYIK